MSNPANNGNNWIVVATTAGIIEATMIAERLKSLGIPAIVQNEPIGAVLGLSIGKFGEARVAVPEVFFQNALNVLEPGDPLLEDSYDDLDDDDEFDAN
jgi:hypothetical protein